MNLHNGHAHEVLARFKEEASLTNFFFYGFLVKGLGAEISTPKD
jgi:hypothetical protein